MSVARENDPNEEGMEMFEAERGHGGGRGGGVPPRPRLAAGTGLAIVPSARLAGRLLLTRDPHDPRNERVRALRTELLLRYEAGDRANFLALLSPGPGEGRSQLAAELAIAFAQLDRHTLLVDADLRNPCQHRLFCAVNESGLAQAIEADSKPRLHEVDGLSHLRLLTSGKLPPNPLELLSDRRFEQLIEDWRRQFEFVIIDTAPVGRYSDGLAVATLAGQVLALSRAGRTLQRDSRQMLQRLTATHSRVLGAVISRF